MVKKTFMVIFFVFLALTANYTVFPQAITIEAALSNAADEIAESVPQGTRIAILSISSDSVNLSDYIINELIANLVNKRLFQIVPRSTVELEAANMEFGFQMSGFVSDESAKSLGKFLGAGTIITGTVTRDSSNSYRLVVNAIDLESFTYQSSYRVSFQNNRQVQTMVGSSGGNFYEDYTTGERIGMGALNMFFGLGSISQKQHLGWLTTAAEIGGLTFIIVGMTVYDPERTKKDYINEGRDDWEEYYDFDVRHRKGFLTAGGLLIGAGIIFGYIIPFFHHKPNNTSVSQNNFPFNFELASSNNHEINGVRILYNMRF